MAHSKALYVKNKVKIEYSSTDLDRITIPFLADRLQIKPERSIPTLQTGQPFNEAPSNFGRPPRSWYKFTRRLRAPSCNVIMVIQPDGAETMPEVDQNRSVLGRAQAGLRG